MIDTTEIYHQLALHSGHRAINGTQDYPDVERWAVLDLDGAYDSGNNRFTHIDIVLTDEPTSFELFYVDWVLIHLNFNDLRTLGASYLMTKNKYTTPIDGINFQLLQTTDGFKIYQLNFD